MEIDALGSRELRLDGVESQTARDDDRRHYHHPHRFHVNHFPCSEYRPRISVCETSFASV